MPSSTRACATTRALRSSQVVEFSPPAAVAARMFGMNFTTWRERPEVTSAHEPEELDAIAKGLGRVATAPEDAAPITWRMRQIVLGRLVALPPPPGVDGPKTRHIGKFSAHQHGGRGRRRNVRALSRTLSS